MACTIIIPVANAIAHILLHNTVFRAFVRVLLHCGIMGAAAVTLSCGRIADPAAIDGAPRLQCDKPVMDFGEMDNQSQVKHCFTLKNVGSGVLCISNVYASCGCMVGKLSEQRVNPGQSIALEPVRKVGFRREFGAT